MNNAMHFLPRLDPDRLLPLLRRWREASPHGGLLALIPEGAKDEVAELQRQCRALGVPLVGGVFPALIEGGSFRSDGAWLLHLDEMPLATLYPDLPSDPEALAEAVDTIAAEIRTAVSGAPDETTLCLLFDSMVANIGSFLDELYLRLANRVRYMGANAGSESFRPMPCLFDSDRILGNAVLAVLLHPHRGAILAHGYGVPEQMIVATSTQGNRILQIDWRPAFDVYRELAQAQYGIAIDRESFYRYAVHFPFGIVRANGVTLVRIPVALEEDGSLFCVGEVPANSMLALLQAPMVDSRQTLETLCAGLGASEGALAGQDLLLFYCAGRRLHLGVEAAEQEIRGLAQRSGVARIAGALSLGEIGSMVEREYPLFHNATLVASLWGRAGR